MQQQKQTPEQKQGERDWRKEKLTQGTEKNEIKKKIDEITCCLLRILFRATRNIRQ